jgi:serine/threonine protein kinase
MVQTSVFVPPEEAPEGALRTGTLVSAYRVDRILGAGGMGWVYRARHALDDRVVALKVLREDQLGQDRAVDRMMREAAILATVTHAGLPTFHQCGLLEDGRPWIAMELVEGTPLSVRMHGGAIVHHDLVIELIGNVADVLAAAHRSGVTHRDLKPDNVLLTPDDAKFPLRVIDWGIAHHCAGARYTNMNEAIGTPTYMAPEQARGGQVDGYCDVYGLGVVAYQALTGRAPFVGATSVEILVQHLNRPVPALGPRCPDAPYGLVELVERMLAKRHEERPTAAEVCETLRGLRGVEQKPAYLFHFAADGTSPVPRSVVDDDTGPCTAVLRPSFVAEE